jgi:eukaryotic-like serine/threonine-protein kinase
MHPAEGDSMRDEAGREVAVFTAASKLPYKDRETFLDIACSGDDDLRRKVEALLRAHDRVGDFLEEPPQADR